VRLSYTVSDEDEAPMMALDGLGVSGNQVQLPAGPSSVVWRFADELGGTEYVEDVELFVRLLNGELIDGGSLHLGMGNDPPEVLLVEPVPTDPADPSESSGNVRVQLKVSDSSSDVVEILVDWRRASDAPDAWQPATAEGVFPSGIETETLSRRRRVLVSSGTRTSTSPMATRTSCLRVRADDGTLDADGVHADRHQRALESALVHIGQQRGADSSALQLNVVVTNSDERRGIPIPFGVVEEENDFVEVLFQWRR
jgi:hypothetical protein